MASPSSSLFDVIITIIVVVLIIIIIIIAINKIISDYWMRF